ncbi:MAG: hypothetical protein KGR68_00380 [Betaproteobacteria bacterium]|nr:hypothetical protein [Betaproteobacteria bacterium]
MRLPVTVVAGLAGHGKAGLIERWRAAGPQPAALVIDRGDDFKFPRADDRAHAAAASDPGLERVGGCACCTGSAALGASLRRLSRRGAWAHLLIDLNGGAHPAAFVDTLRAPPLAAGVRLVELVSVIEAERLSARLAGPQRRWLVEQVQSADRVVLWIPAAMPPVVIEERVEQLLTLSADTGFAPEIQVWRDGTPPPPPKAGEPTLAVPTSSGGHTQALSAAFSGGQAAVLLAAVPGEVPRWHWRWRAPPEKVFDRLGLIEAVAEMAHASVDIAAVLRTEREWYRYQAGRWEPDLWRRDSRVVLRIEPDRLASLQAPLATFADRLSACERGA